MNRKNNKKNTIADPEGVYEMKNRSLKTFHSFEEMNEADAQSAAKTLPLELLKNASELIKKIYTKELQNPFDKKIKFR